MDDIEILRALILGLRRGIIVDDVDPAMVGDDPADGVGDLLLAARSNAMPTALRPVSRIAAAAASTRAASMSVRIAVAPRSARSAATTAPMPPPAPVTIATLPSNICVIAALPFFVARI